MIVQQQEYEHEHEKASPEVVGRSTSLADLTPTQSRSGSPASMRGSRMLKGTARTGTGGSDPISFRSPGDSASHDSLLFPTLDNLNSAHSLTPKHRPSPLVSTHTIHQPPSSSSLSPTCGMPSSHPGTGQHHQHQQQLQQQQQLPQQQLQQQQQQQRPGPSRRHQPQQVRQSYGQSFSQPPPQQQQSYYPSSLTIPTPERGYLSRNQSSLSSASGQGFVAGNLQSPQGYMGHYSMSPTSPTMYGPPQYTYSQQPAPGLHIPGMPPPPLSHSHSAPPMTFGMSISSSHPGIYAPSYVPSTSIRSALPQHQQTQDHTPSPPSGFEQGSSQPGPGPPNNASAAAGATYTPSPQQPFPMYNYGHPQLTTTPQFPPYNSSPFQQQAQQGAHYPHTSYAYMTAPSPTSAEDHASAPPPISWWYVQSPTSAPGPSSANAPPSSGSTPYGSIYYIDAYGNPAPAPLSTNYAGPMPLSVNHPPMGSSMQHPHRSPSALGVGSTVAFSPGPGLTGPARVSRSGSSIVSARDLPPLSPLALGDSASERAPSTAASATGGMPDGTMRRGPGIVGVERSDWVMWVGNVPSDATHDELWRFFTAPKSNLLGGPGLVPLQRVSSLPQPHVSTLPQQQPHLLPSGLLSPAGSSSASSARFSTNSEAASVASGVQSIFLIARSNCAFVNYATAAHLSVAVATFNGMQLRPGDPRCPRLVCRVRGRDEDQRAGVGGQRNMGMHTRWVKQQKELEREKERERLVGRAGEEPREGEGHTTGDSEAESAAGGDRRRRPPHSSSSGSTTSGFLQQNFPQRYFILKSLTQYDLDLSVRRGLWATQVHNETVLNQAYRTSKDVYLIFGVNKSGEFFGYARMAGLIGKAEEKVPWASRSDSAHSHSPAASLSSSLANRSQISEPIPEESESQPREHGTKTAASLPERREREPPSDRPSLMLFSPDHQARNSPQPVTKREEHNLEEIERAGSNVQSGEACTAPPAMGRMAAPWMHSPLVEPETAPAIMERSAKDPKSSSTPLLVKPASATMDPRLLIYHPSMPLNLNPEAPKLAIRANQSKNQDGAGTSSVSGSGEYVDEDNIKRRDMHASGSAPRAAQRPETRKEASSASQSALTPPSREDYNQPTTEQEQTEQSQWGTPFKIQWIKVGRLPFHRTRNLRNPWNHEREVKVSRDGTELEPGVGQALLNEWDKEETAPTPVHPPQVSSPTGAGSGSGEREAGLSTRRGGSTSGHSRRRTQPGAPSLTDRESGSPHSASAPPPPPRPPFAQRGRGR